MFKIVFMAAFVTMQGPTVQPVEETTKFKSAKECEAFGGEMHGRVADWVRGVLHADWDYKVKVMWKCEAEGDPA